ncbi:nucleotide-binding universal stress UspA family protein [Aliiruegeria haliotis]|uniref:Nucleotide-binding universal stress UspA family protein n=1 Tax=Aliiruegeria haliotis TaxID=1280846 RepID=A0A2T0RRT9_9RHOB|nr:universal stress protein [Aliiruegeria haliotis]PRY23803.1 nucleotide-binding universal stress UspA family protein [Aliiruegeria haliotis]
MYSNILVPVSFEADRNARESMEIAQAIRAEGGKITLLHVMEHLPQYATEYLPADHLDKARDDITGGLAALAEGVGNAEVVVVEGHSARTILDYADEVKADCIIIASHRPGMQDFFLGSTAARVVRHARCAVHVVR